MKIISATVSDARQGHGSDFMITGSLKRCIVAEDILRDGLLLRAGSWAAFHRNGVIENYKLTEEAVIQGVVCKTGDILLFDEEGRVTETIRPASLPS